MGVQQQLSLEDPHSSLNWSPPSKQKEEHLPTMRRKQLPWNQHYPGHPTTATILSLYSFAQSPCVKLSFIHPILEHSQSTIFHQLHVLFHLYSMDPWPIYHSKQRSSQQSSQRSHHHSLPQTQCYLFLYLVPFGLLMKQLVMLYQHTNMLPQYTNNEGFPMMQSRSITKDTILLALQSGHHPSLRQYLIRRDSSQNPICLNCCLEVQDLLQCLCECLTLMTIRQRVFGNHHGYRQH